MKCVRCDNPGKLQKITSVWDDVPETKKVIWSKVLCNSCWDRGWQRLQRKIKGLCPDCGHEHNPKGHPYEGQCFAQIDNDLSKFLTYMPELAEIENTGKATLRQ